MEIFECDMNFARETGRDDIVVTAHASQQCGPGSIPSLAVVCKLSLFSVGSRLFSLGFSPDTPIFPSPQKQYFKMDPESEVHGFVSRRIFTKIIFFTLFVYVIYCEIYARFRINRLF